MTAVPREYDVKQLDEALYTTTMEPIFQLHSPSSARRRCSKMTPKGGREARQHCQ